MAGLTSFAALGAILNAHAQGAPSGVVMGSRSSLQTVNTIMGPTGLISVPTAYTNNLNQARVGASFTNGTSGPSVNYGIYPSIEVGGAFLQRRNKTDRVVGNAKVTLLPSNFKFAEVGIGVIDAADAVGRTWYAVASFDLVVPNVESKEMNTEAVAFRGHAGVGNGMFGNNIFGGAELLFGNRVSAVGEWDTKNVNGAIRYAHNEAFVAQVGIYAKRLYVGFSTQIRF